MCFVKVQGASRFLANTLTFDEVNWKENPLIEETISDYPQSSWISDECKV